MKPNTLYYGDCLDVMKKWPDKCVDLIYLDPPFNSKANYNILFGKDKLDKKHEPDLAQLTAFSDIWQWDAKDEERVQNMANAIDHPAHRAICAFKALWPEGNGMLSYLSYMAERLVEMQRLLKDTGSIYLHCDPTASHFLKIMLDGVFGGENFRNEIIWWYRKFGRGESNFKKNHDTLLYYANSDAPTFNALYEDFSPKTMVDKYKRELVAGKWVQNKNVLMKDIRKHDGVPMGNTWEISFIHSQSKERLGYPTQKPLALLKRIIKASSNRGDVVLDPFCGCGTTIDAAMQTKRNWVGIDISTYAIEVIRRERLKDRKIELHGLPQDLEAATLFARKQPFDFEKWAVTRIPGFAPNEVQIGDGGVDGRALILNPPDNIPAKGLCIVQVKGSEKPAAQAVDALFGKVANDEAAIGIFISLKKGDTRRVRECIAKAGHLQFGATKFPRFVSYSIEEYFHKMKPNLPPFAHPRTGKALQEELL